MQCRTPQTLSSSSFTELLSVSWGWDSVCGRGEPLSELSMATA
ncbi:hypothetical protein ACRE_030570 [Hapsidospora chrysogenum ATCC 11550]|uniref:Uncharacterized protein n=1 Tax=Hapsidospora chrysogenum (strain ATCC 11550 / CBS 779.69 / DSM 880 / IAM 14645 / JCM 23072 / IMI 49137) TaxID=857340 RepID=A0A086T9R7_HAPC1|nr:hypothetical protein ACRE_030570 [Hapsidospora chrysogenum ATCC 11550]